MSKYLEPSYEKSVQVDEQTNSIDIIDGVNQNILKRTRTTHAKLLSHSAPNTSFIIKQILPSMDNTSMGDDEDINSNPATEHEKQGDPNKADFQFLPQYVGSASSSGGSSPMEIIKRTGNSIEVSIDVHDNKNMMSSRVGLDHHPKRIDVLWKVQEGKPPDTDASVSNCFLYSEEEEQQQQEQQIQSLKFPQNRSQNRSRIIPQFQQKHHERNWDKDEIGSQTNNIDPNENNILLVKKSEEDQGDHVYRPGNDGDIHMPPNGYERKIRKEPLTWPWHSGSYHMNIRFQTPDFRTEFSNKVIILKALQWLLATIWTFVAYHINYLRESQNDLAWTVYLAIFLLMSTFLTIRSTSFVDNQTSIVILIIYTICITHISAMLHIHYDCTIIPIIILTMTTTYILSAITFACIRIDADSPIVFYPIIVYVILTSILSFWFVLSLSNETIQNPLGKMLTTWFPCCLLAMIVCSLEMLEIQALLRGTRIPLEPTEWILATTFLL